MTAPLGNGGVGGLVLTGVTMELAGTPEPATVIPGVVLTVSTEGLVVAPPPPAEPVAVGWSSIGRARCGEEGILSDGEPAVAISAVVGGRMTRWLVPAAQMPPERAFAVDHLLVARTVPPAGETAAGAGVTPGARARPAPRTTSRATSPRATSPRTTSPRPAPRRAMRPALSGQGGRRVVALSLWFAVLLLLFVGVALLAASFLPSIPSRDGGSSAHGGARNVATDRTIARSASLRRSELPAGWTASSTPSGPLSGFVRDGGSAGGAAGTAGRAAGAQRYESCLGVRSATVPVVGTTPTTPVARTASGAFAGPATGPTIQVASITDVYASDAPVERAVAELRRAHFASCFGDAVSEEFGQSVAESAHAAGVSAGQATVASLPLPKWAGIRATGVDLDLPLDIRGTATSVQLGFVFVTGGRVETTLVTFGTQSFPEGIARALAAVLEEEIATSEGG